MSEIDMSLYLLRNEKWLGKDSADGNGYHKTDGILTDDEISVFFSSGHLNNVEEDANITEEEFSNWYAANKATISSFLSEEYGMDYSSSKADVYEALQDLASNYLSDYKNNDTNNNYTESDNKSVITQQQELLFKDDMRVKTDSNGDKYVTVDAWGTVNNGNDCLSRIIQNSYDLKGMGIKIHSKEYRQIEKVVMDANPNIYGTENGGGRKRILDGSRNHAEIYAGDKITLPKLTTLELNTNNNESEDEVSFSTESDIGETLTENSQLNGKQPPIYNEDGSVTTQEYNNGVLEREVTLNEDDSLRQLKTNTIVNGKITQSEVSTYYNEGNVVVVETYDETGRLTKKTLREGKNNTFYKYNDKGEIFITAQEYNEKENKYETTYTFQRYENDQLVDESKIKDNVLIESKGVKIVNGEIIETRIFTNTSDETSYNIYGKDGRLLESTVYRGNDHYIFFEFDDQGNTVTNREYNEQTKKYEITVTEFPKGKEATWYKTDKLSEPFRINISRIKTFMKYKVYGNDPFGFEEL